MTNVYFGRSYQFEPGEYRLKVQWKDPVQGGGAPKLKHAWAYADLSWKEPIIPNIAGSFVVGGLRIARIVDTDGITGRDVVRWFDYDYNETVSGVPPYSGTSGIIQKTCLRFYFSGWVIVPSNFSLQTSGGDHVGYRKVAITYGADKKGGKQVSYFTSAVEYPDGNMAISKQLASGYEPTEVPWRRGLVERVVDLKFENDDYRVVREMENKYTFFKQPTDANNYQYVNIRDGATFKTVSEAFYMHESTERQKYSPGELVTTTTFEQNPLNLAISKTTTSTSEGDEQQVVTKYPVDYDDVENISALKTGNFISIPIKTETIKNDKLLDGTVIKYTDAGQPTEVYRYENNNLITVPPHSDNTIVPSNYVLRSQFSYGAVTNKLEESKQPDNNSTCYIWGYDRAFPVIKIENMSSEQIPSSLISSIEGHLFTGSTKVSDFQGDVNFLNDQVNTLRGDSRYRVTTYTYNTAFGITSQTDINGETIYYEYDAFGRLETIRDSQQNIVKRYKYHYQNEN
jgi:YD repeat-containing protein